MRFSRIIPVLVALVAGSGVALTQACGSGISDRFSSSYSYFYTIEANASGDDHVSGYRLELRTGAVQRFLGPKVMDFTGGTDNGAALAIHPDGSPLFVASDTIRLAAATVAAGTDTYSQGSPVAMGNNATTEMAFDPLSNTVWSMQNNEYGRIHFSNGVLASQAPQSLGADVATEIEFHPTENRAYIRLNVNQMRDAYVDTTPSPDEITLVSDISSASLGSQMRLTPDGEYLYITNPGANEVCLHQIGVGGILTGLACFVAGTDVPTDLAISPSGDRIYYFDNSANRIGAMTVSGGTLAADASFTKVNTMSGVTFMEVDPTGQYLVVGGGTEGLDVFRIGAGEALIPIDSGSDVGSSATLVDLVFSP